GTGGRNADGNALGHVSGGGIRHAHARFGGGGQPADTGRGGGPRGVIRPFPTPSPPTATPRDPAAGRPKASQGPRPRTSPPRQWCGPAPKETCCRAFSRRTFSSAASGPQKLSSRLAEARLAMTNAPAGIVVPTTVTGSRVIRLLACTGLS